MFLTKDNYLDIFNQPPGLPESDWRLIKHALVKDHELEYVTEPRLFTTNQYTEYLRLLLTIEKYPDLYCIKKEDRGSDGVVMSLYTKDDDVL